jgi:hypothetical protein
VTPATSTAAPALVYDTEPFRIETARTAIDTDTETDITTGRERAG